jgi:cytidylate kinase
MKKIVIAIDGHSACGKSTLAKAIAQELKYIYVDSGAMYRAITLFAMDNGYLNDAGELKRAELINDLNRINISFNYNKVTGKSDTFLNGINVEDEIRNMRISNQVSLISSIKEVREKLVEFQQQLGKNKGIVMDGRDIGTVVFPSAELKLWITASVEVRTARRYKELLENGHKITFSEVEQNVVKRDLIDSTRDESPLRRSDDAQDIDNSLLSKSETLNKAIAYANNSMLED